VFYSPTLFECQAAGAKHRRKHAGRKAKSVSDIIRQKTVPFCLGKYSRASVAGMAYFLLIWS